MAAYGSTTSIMMEKFKKLQTKVLVLTKERDDLKEELKKANEKITITTESENVGPNPNRERIPVKTAEKKKSAKTPTKKK